MYEVTLVAWLVDGTKTTRVGRDVALLTVTHTPADVRDAPSSSNAFAVNVYVPTAGAGPRDAVRAVESDLSGSSPDRTRLGHAASASPLVAWMAMFAGAVNDAPAAGDEIETEGA